MTGWPETSEDVCIPLYLHLTARSIYPFTLISVIISTLVTVTFAVIESCLGLQYQTCFPSYGECLKSDPKVVDYPPNKYTTIAPVGTYCLAGKCFSSLV